MASWKFKITFELTAQFCKFMASSSPSTRVQTTTNIWRASTLRQSEWRIKGSQNHLFLSSTLSFIITLLSLSLPLSSSLPLLFLSLFIPFLFRAGWTWCGKLDPDQEPPAVVADSAAEALLGRFRELPRQPALAQVAVVAIFSGHQHPRGGVHQRVHVHRLLPGDENCFPRSLSYSSLMGMDGWRDGWTKGYPATMHARMLNN